MKMSHQISHSKQVTSKYKTSSARQSQQEKPALQHNSIKILVIKNSVVVDSVH